MARLTKEEVKGLQEKLYHWGTSRPLALRDTLDTIDALESELAEARARAMPDFSPGDVISAEKDGTIVLDDGITTWNPTRACEFLLAKQDVEARASTAAMLEKLKLLATEVRIDHNGSGLPFSGYDSCHKLGFDTCTSPKCVSIRALITADQSAALAEHIKEAQIEMYEMLCTLPEASHEGECGPEAGCDATCMDREHFGQYVNDLYKAVGKKRLSERVIAALQPTEEGGTSKPTGS